MITTIDCLHSIHGEQLTSSGVGAKKNIKMKLIHALLILNCCLFFIQKTTAQEITKDDYKRAVSFMYDNYNNKTAFNLNTRVNWFEDNSGIWFLNHTSAGKEYKTVDFKDFKVRSMFDQKKIAQILSKHLNEEVDPMKLPISGLKKNKKGELTFEIFDKKYTLDPKRSKIKVTDVEPEEQSILLESKSPDEKWIAFPKDHNLFIRSVETGKEFQLTFDGKKNYEYAMYYGWFDQMEGENGERPKHFQVNWSKDSKWINVSLTDLRSASKMYLLDWSVDTLYRPRLLGYYRGSPGDTNMVYVQEKFFNVETKKEIKTDLPRNTHINAVSTRWAEETGVVIAQYSERGYQKLFVKKINLNTEETTTLVEETSQTNIDNFRRWPSLIKGKIVFFSERSGWRQLYASDYLTGKVSPITVGNFYVNRINHIDKENGIIYFMASGKEEGMNPYHQMLYSVSVNGGEIKLLTPKRVHHVIDFSEDGKYFVDNYSTVEEPTKTVLRERVTGREVELTKADVSLLTIQGWKAPQVFEMTAKDGKTTIYGALWKPMNFDPNKKYPIIDHSYTGPHTQMFPRTFSRGLLNQNLAELGFVVMMVDGLGSSGRSKAFHNHSYKNMGNNLEDHVLAIKHLGKKYNWIDADRAGIFGHSAGGFDAGHGILAFPDTYKVAVASSADHDFRMEKAWWPEMYMGWPVDETYEAVSNITIAKNLKGKLLLVHGGLDDNVNPSATFKLAEALVKADKQFDLLILPSQKHGYRGAYRKYFIKKRWNYFVEHLRGGEPIWEFEWD